MFKWSVPQTVENVTRFFVQTDKLLKYIQKNEKKTRFFAKKYLQNSKITGIVKARSGYKFIKKKIDDGS